jgi:serine/threonine protein kinase
VIYLWALYSAVLSLPVLTFLTAATEGFTLDGTVKIMDFGLAKLIENASVDSDDVYAMSGETGSLRYMAPEVADGLRYNYSADVYSFGIILWELNAMKKPFEGLSRDLFYERVVHGGERPPLSRKWPAQLTSLMSECWDAEMHNRPKFRDIVVRLDALLEKEKGGTASAKKKQFLPKISGMIDRHSTWF